MTNSEIELKELSDNPDMNNYFRELNEDMTLTRSNIIDKSLKVSVYRVKWLNKLKKEQENFRRITEMKEKILKSKLKNNPSESVLKMKSEDIISDNDEKIKKLNDYLKKVKDNIDCLERCQDILANFGFNIKYYTDLYKLEHV